MSNSPACQASQMLYFAYGANLRRGAFSRLCPGADWLGVARLEGHRFVIATHGYASVQPEAGSTVWGVLWLVPATHLPALDAFEEVEGGLYVRTTARVVSPAGPRIEVMIYVATGPDTGAAYPRYLEEVLEGARENKLPKDYIAKLAAWPVRTGAAPAVLPPGKDSH